MSEEKKGLQEQIDARKHNLHIAEVPGWATSSPRESTPGDIFNKYTDVSADQLPDSVLQTAGRITGLRSFGKAMFIQVGDHTGTLQIYCKKNTLGDVFALCETLDVGDVVDVSGTLFRTKTDAITLAASSVKLLTKSLRPPPEKFHGLQDLETRHRKRYLDLLSNSESRDRFKARSRLVQELRAFMTAREFIEVETPILYSLASGAAAKPFSTHHNALDMPLQLRIAPELNLKRLLVGGFDKVFEIGKNFRNEGISPQHNPEFTMIEFYWAYAQMSDLISTIRSLIIELADAVGTPTSITWGGQENIKVRESVVTTVQSLIVEHNQHCNAAYDSTVAAATFLRDTLQDQSKLAQRLIEIYARVNNANPSFQNLEAGESIAQAIDWMSSDKINDPEFTHGLMFLYFEEEIEGNLVQPTFVTDYPAYVSPLSRRKDDAPHLVDRFELFVAGRELANGFNELNDPADQQQRFEQQLALKSAGDDEAMAYDHDYIEALEYGMPPAAGAGIGVDRLVMLLTETDNIRDVILFPLLRAAD